MPQSSNYIDVDDNNAGVDYLDPLHWQAFEDTRAHYGMAHKPLAIGAKVIYAFVGELFYL